MTRKLGILASVVTALALGASSVFGAITFHQGPSFTDEGGGYTVNLFAEASGLGNTDLTGTVTFSADVQYTCRNKGGNTAPGQPLHIDQQFSQNARANSLSSAH